MSTEKAFPTRKRNRLSCFDYSQNGCYFVTICTKNRAQILSRVIAGANALCTVSFTHAGLAVDKWLNATAHYYGVLLVKYIIMPNHLHLLLQIEDGIKERATVSRMIKHFKTNVTRELGESIWQKSFYDHVIRDADDFSVKYAYIENNPANWILRRDEYHPDAVRRSF